ncbi:hypothetical protein B1R32_1316 [Abditibacterium utsteinense]|uniref:Uncharacterized protein n=1 Tax=Abditibacterium utsteinense TaxID=1960156 RepID=A0A2S8SNX6_9BACT|nr:hypothetical protein [Abditibacterium utsteinense]PQV62493.1 hypothetical protein B1R32_1316 [Abditibacterium utsteinense]
MIRQIATFVGRHFLRQAVASGAQKTLGNALDPKFGLKLLRDRRIPLKSKVAAFALGLGAVVVLEILELPLQTALALLLPFIGLAADFALDGVELLAGPLLFATLMLPYLAPRDIVEQIRAEAGQTDSQGRVYVTAPVSNSSN